MVLRNGRELDEEAVQGLRQGRTSPATRCPREVVFVEELPRNATGKVLKRELREREPSARLSPPWRARPRWPARCAVRLVPRASLEHARATDDFDLAGAAPQPPARGAGWSSRSPIEPLELGGERYDGEPGARAR